MEKYKLPPIEVWDRYSNPYRFNMIKNYHIKLAQKCDWRVRTFDDDKGYTDTYYCNGSLDDIEHYVFQATDCNWTPKDAYHKPMNYYVNNIVHIFTEEYFSPRTTPLIEHGYDAEIIGSKTNEKWKWKWKHFSMNHNYMTCMLHDGSWTISHKKSGDFGWNSHGYHQKEGGLDNAKTVYIKKLNSDQLEAVQWMIEKLSHKKYEGFYDDVIDILKGGKVDENQNNYILKCIL